MGISMLLSILTAAVLLSLLPARVSLAAESEDSPGAVDGSFSVGPQGSASYAVPIICPPGTAGMVPQLALTYNSQAGPGVMGPGWSIAGYSIITRGPKNLDRDGIVAGAQFDSTDALFLDGVRLIPVQRATDDSYVEY